MAGVAVEFGGSTPLLRTFRNDVMLGHRDHGVPELVSPLCQPGLVGSGDRGLPWLRCGFQVHHVRH